MSELMTFKFSDLCDVTRGASPRPIHEWISATGGTPWVKISDATASNSRFIESTRERIHNAGRNKSVLVQPGDLILSNSATPGIPKLMKIEACIHDGWLLLRNFRNLDKLYAYYLLLSIRPRLVNEGNGSVFTNLKTEILKNFEVLLPPLPEQRAIADILSAFDDKIDLNRRMNDTLEATARALFQSWFVDFDPVHAKAAGRSPDGMDADTAALFPDSFEESALGLIPSGWRVGTLGEITSYVIGGDWGKDEPTEIETIETLCIRGADIPDLQSGGLGKMPSRFIKSSSAAKRVLKPNDIVIEISGGSPTQSTGRAVFISPELLARLPYPLVFSNFCRLVRLVDPVPAIYVYLWLRSLYSSDALLKYETGTTGIKNFAYTIFSEQHPLLLPPEMLLKKFEGFAKRFYQKHQANGAEMQTLAETRDALLPKLISGQVRVESLQSP